MKGYRDTLKLYSGYKIDELKTEDEQMTYKSNKTYYFGNVDQLEVVLDNNNNILNTVIYFLKEQQIETTMDW